MLKRSSQFETYSNAFKCIRNLVVDRVVCSFSVENNDKNEYVNFQCNV